MVVGDDDLHAALDEGGDHLAVARSAVDGDDELEPRLETTVHDAPREPVAVLRAVGNEEMNVRAEPREDLDEERGPADAVRVVIAVHEDLIAPRDRLVEDARRLRHLVEEKGIVEMLDRGIEYPMGVVDARNAARGEKPRLERAQTEPVLESPQYSLVHRLQMPYVHARSVRGLRSVLRNGDRRRRSGLVSRVLCPSAKEGR